MFFSTTAIVKFVKDREIVRKCKVAYKVDENFIPSIDRRFCGINCFRVTRVQMLRVVKKTAFHTETYHLSSQQFIFTAYIGDPCCYILL